MGCSSADEDLKLIQGNKDHFSCKCPTMMVVIIVVMHVLITVPVSLQHLTWFQAQEKCRDLNESLTLNKTQSGTFYWTGYYKRLSLWIKIIGCYNESVVRNFDNQSCTLTSSSPGLCQEFCLFMNQTIFAIQGNQCICLPHPLDVLPLIPDMCNYTCDNSLLLTSECGGESTFNVFESDSIDLKIKCDCLSLQCKGQEQFVDQQTDGCNSYLKMICKATVNKTKEDLSKPWRVKMSECQSNGAYLLGNISLSNTKSACAFVHEKGRDPRWIGVVRDTYETKDRGRQIFAPQKTLFKMCKKCQIKNHKSCEYVNCMEELTSKVYCTNGKEVTVPDPQYTAPTSVTHETATVISSTDTMDSTAKVSKDKVSVTPIVVPVVLFVILGSILITLIIRRKKITRTRHEETKTNATIKQKDNHQINIQGVSNENYFVLQASNITNQSTEKDQFQSDDPDKVTEEGTYDHLREKGRRRKSVDDTYNHTSSIKIKENSYYDVAHNIHWKQQDDSCTYDHTNINGNPYSGLNSIEYKETNYSEFAN